MTKNNPRDNYLWCDRCRRSFRYEHVADYSGLCPVCAGELTPIGKFTAILRGLMANEVAASPLETRHRQLVRLIWTANGMGEQYYHVLEPEISYSRFEAKVTDLLCRGAEEGWVRFVIPPSPRPDPTHYRMELDEERFVSELHRMVEALALEHPKP